MANKTEHLIDYFVPSDYRLKFYINSDKTSLQGQTTINGTVVKSTKKIRLHAKNLNIISILAYRQDNNLAVLSWEIQESQDFLVIDFGESVSGEISITIDYSLDVTDNLSGVYPSYYKESDVTKKIIATQLESHHAREVFPCIDEPEAKAVFTTTITTNADDVVLSNNEEIDVSFDGPTKTTSFAPTPRMSTYLLAFVSGDLGFVEGVTKSGVKVRVFSTKDKTDQLEFGLRTAISVLEYFEEYFEIKYPLTKCDMVALPDFDAGAMENWGLVTFRESCLLVDEQDTALSTKQYVAIVVAHELAHQWFGNLVTMKWWDDLWLNEGFASWIEFLAVDKIFPEWKIWEQFTTDEWLRALKLDALDSTHPVYVPINNPDEIRTIFDVISYSKGSSIIQMLHHYMGAEKFRRGLIFYLKQYAYSNATTVQLWQALEESSKMPISKFMHNWTDLPGFPIMSVKRSGEDLLLEQERFFLDADAVVDNTVWSIPLLTNSQKYAHVVFDSKKTEISNDGDSPLIFNHNQSGFYRTIYDQELMTEIIASAKNGQVSDQELYGVISDGFEASKVGKTNLVPILDLLPSVKDSQYLGLWESITLELASIRRIMDHEQLRQKLCPYLENLGINQYQRLELLPKSSDTSNDLLLRPNIIGLMALANYQPLIDQAMDIFVKSKKPTDIPTDVRANIYIIVARNGTVKHYNKLLRYYDNTTSAEEKINICIGICNFESTKLAERSLRLMRDGVVKSQDLTYWISGLLGNRFTRQVTWEWLKVNWLWIKATIGDGMGYYRLPNMVASGVSDANFIKEYTDFFDSIDQSGLQRNIAQGLETIKWQSSWKERELRNIVEYFNK